MSRAQPHLSVIIPAYNEAERVVPTLERTVAFLQSQNYPWEIMVVDDGSTDATPRLVAEFGAGVAGIDIIQNPHRGKGYAVKTGMLAAHGQYRLFTDADLSVPIEEVTRFLPPQLAGYDIAIGSREAPGARRYNEPPLRHWMGRVYNWLFRFLLIPRVQDSQCGFKVFTAAATQALFPLVLIDGWAFDSEVLFLAFRRGMKVVEVPVPWYFGKRSKVNPLRDTWRMMGEVMAVRWNQWRGRYA